MTCARLLKLSFNTVRFFSSRGEHNKSRLVDIVQSFKYSMENYFVPDGKAPNSYCYKLPREMLIYDVKSLLNAY
jgi:hypothetical protein